MMLSEKISIIEFLIKPNRNIFFSERFYLWNWIIILKSS